MSNAATRPLGESLDPRQRWLLVASLMVSMFMGALDQTIMATAAPRIVADLGGFHLLSWVFTTYMLASTVVVPLVGKLSDIYGRKIFLMSGMVLFLLASAGCGAAPNMATLIGFRALQGAGGGIVFSSVFATIGDIFPPAERGKYMGLFTGTFTLASVLGPTVGGLLTDHAGWRWVFYINIPVGAVALPAIWYNLPFARSNKRTRIDYLGALSLSVATVSALLALAWSGEELGWGSPTTIGLFAVALIAIGAFVMQERSHPEPIVPFHLFRIREFLLGNLIVLGIGLAMMGVIPYLPTFLQTALDATATASGLVTTPQSLGLLVTSILGGQLLSRTGRYKAQTIIGGVLMLCAMLLMLTLGPDSPAWHLSVFVVILGLGGGLVMPTMSVVIQNAVPHEFLGVATSSRQFFMQIGGVVGTAIFGVLLTSSFQSEFRQDVSPETQAQVDPAVLQKFEDPTLALDERTFSAVSTQILAQPGGEALLADAQHAQESAITTAIHTIFFASVCIIAGTIVLSLFLKEVPLRRSFGPQEVPAEGAEGVPQEPVLALH